MSSNLISCVIQVRTDEFDKHFEYFLVAALAVQFGQYLVCAYIAQQHTQVGDLFNARDPCVKHFGHPLDEAGRFFLGDHLSLGRYPASIATLV